MGGRDIVTKGYCKDKFLNLPKTSQINLKIWIRHFLSKNKLKKKLNDIDN